MEHTTAVEAAGIACGPVNTTAPTARAGGLDDLRLVVINWSGSHAGQAAEELAATLPA